MRRRNVRASLGTLMSAVLLLSAAACRAPEAPPASASPARPALASPSAAPVKLVAVPARNLALPVAELPLGGWQVDLAAPTNANLGWSQAFSPPTPDAGGLRHASVAVTVAPSTLSLDELADIFRSTTCADRVAVYVRLDTLAADASGDASAACRARVATLDEGVLTFFIYAVRSRNVVIDAAVAVDSNGDEVRALDTAIALARRQLAYVDRTSPAR